MVRRFVVGTPAGAYVLTSAVVGKVYKTAGALNSCTLGMIEIVGSMFVLER